MDDNIMKKIAYLLKTSKKLYIVYFFLFSSILKVLGFFVKTEEKLILFNSYGGKKMDDSPKAIYDAMCNDERFNMYRMVWALQEPKLYKERNIESVKCDTLKFFILALKAKVWVTNSSIERGLSFKKKSTICFNTWHGTTIKKMGNDIQDDNLSFRGMNHVSADVMLAQSQYDINIFSQAFEIPKERFYCIGLPRNDILVNYKREDALLVRKKLGIPEDKKILLYAPTFREYTTGKEKEVILHIPISLDYWQQRLEKEYVVLFRAHYEVAKHMDVSGYSAFIDVSSYHCLNDLMIVSDALISDYSSIFFDYSIMHKPMYCFAYDYEEYIENRGMYLDLKKELPCVMHKEEESLIDEIVNNTNNNLEKIKIFQNKYVAECGDAARKSCDILYRMLTQSKRIK